MSLGTRLMAPLFISWPASSSFVKGQAVETKRLFLLLFYFFVVVVVFLISAAIGIIFKLFHKSHSRPSVVFNFHQLLRTKSFIHSESFQEAQTVTIYTVKHKL